MSFLLDTNVCSAYLKRPALLAHRFVQHGGRLHISTVVLHELLTWVYRRPDPNELLSKVRLELIREMKILDFDLPCAERSGQLRANLLNSGISVPAAVLMIAATALVHDLTVVTHNTKHFKLIPGLQIEDWISP